MSDNNTNSNRSKIGIILVVVLLVSFFSLLHVSPSSSSSSFFSSSNSNKMKEDSDDWKIRLKSLFDSYSSRNNKRQEEERGQKRITKVIIEVGTSLSPEFSQVAANDPNTLFIGIEPLAKKVFENFFAAPYSSKNETRQQKEAKERNKQKDLTPFLRFEQEICEKRFGSSSLKRCIVLPIAIFSKYQDEMERQKKNKNEEIQKRFHLAIRSTCSSLLAQGRRCATSERSILVPIFTLDELLDEIPASYQISLLAIDGQGADFKILSSLKSQKHRQRISQIIFECQDLKSFIAQGKLYLNDAQRTCGEIEACIMQEWKSEFSLHSCSQNYEHAEYNCNFVNKNKNDLDIIRHPFVGGDGGEAARNWKIKHKSQCPAQFWRFGEN